MFSSARAAFSLASNSFSLASYLSITFGMMRTSCRTTGSSVHVLIVAKMERSPSPFFLGT